MRIAVIGLGVIGNVHIKVINATGNNLVAVCDTDKEKLSLFPDIKGYTDYIQMLDEVKPDVVHICTPHHLHTEMIISALDRDINVLCEKPVCINKQDIVKIIDAENRSKAQLGVSFQNRYNPTTIFIKEYLKDKKIVSAHGRLVWRRDAEYYGQDAWHGKLATEGGGVLINQAIHTIDLFQYLFGMPTEITAWCSNLSLQGVIDVEDTAMLLCSGEQDFSILATNAGIDNFPVEITVQTESSTVKIIGDKVWIDDICHEKKANDKQYGKAVYGSGHTPLILDFYDCVKTGRKFAIDGKESSKAVSIVLSAYESDGKKIKI